MTDRQYPNHANEVKGILLLGNRRENGYMGEYVLNGTNT